MFPGLDVVVFFDAETSQVEWVLLIQKTSLITLHRDLAIQSPSFSRCFHRDWVTTHKTGSDIWVEPEAEKQNDNTVTMHQCMKKYRNLQRRLKGSPLDLGLGIQNLRRHGFRYMFQKKIAEIFYEWRLTSAVFERKRPIFVTFFTRRQRRGEQKMN